MSRQNVILALVLLIALGSAQAVVKEKTGVTVTDPQRTPQALLEQADTVFQSHDYAAALDRYREVVSAARSARDRSVEVEGLAQMARMNLIMGTVDEGRLLLDEATSLADDNDPMAWSRLLGVRGRFEWKGNDLVNARRTFQQMYDYCNINALWGRAVDAAHMVAIVAETPQQQIEWSQKGIEAAEAADVESWLGPLWNNMAVTYYDNKDFDSALQCFQKAREYHWRFSGETGKLFADYHVGMTFRHLGQFEEAGKWLRPVLAWAERLENHGAIGQACEDLGEAALGLGNQAEGIELLKKARREYQLEGYDQSWKEVWSHINQRLKELGVD